MLLIKMFYTFLIKLFFSMREMSPSFCMEVFFTDRVAGVGVENQGAGKMVAIGRSSLQLLRMEVQAFTGMARVKQLLFSVIFFWIRSELSKSFCSYRLLLSQSLGQREAFIGGIFSSAPIGVSRLLVPLNPSLAYMRQKEN